MVTEVGPFGFLGRRRWLKWALTGGVVLGGGGAGLLALRGCAEDVSGLKALSDHEYRTLAAVAATLLPRGGPFPDGAADHDLTRQLDAFLAGEPPEVLADLKRALWLFEYGPLLFERSLTTFSQLGPEARLAQVERWGRSDGLLRRQVALAFRKMMGLFFYDQPGVWAHIGYPGPSLWGKG